MPNWTSNRLRIQTDSDSQREFKKIAELKEIFESDNPFRKIIPEPNWLEIKNDDGELPIENNIKILSERWFLLLENFLAQEELTIDGIVGGFKTGGLNGMPVVLKLQGMMKII